MIAKKDIDNVRSIMEKTKQQASSDVEKQKYEGLIRSFETVAEQFLKEVNNNARLQLHY